MTKDLTKFKRRKRPGPEETHGAYSKLTQKKYSDLRTKQGQRLEAVTQGLIADLGGPESICTAQNILISNIKAKLMVLFQISDWADKQKTIVDDASGELIPALGRNFISYTEAVRRDLSELTKLAPKKLSKDLYEKHRDSVLQAAGGKK